MSALGGVVGGAGNLHGPDFFECRLQFSQRDDALLERHALGALVRDRLLQVGNDLGLVRIASQCAGSFGKVVLEGGVGRLVELERAAIEAAVMAMRCMTQIPMAEMVRLRRAQ